MKKWFFHKAKYYECWYPQSGLAGGLILAIPFVILIWIFK